MPAPLRDDHAPTPCQVCGEPGLVQAAPGGAWSGCWCREHAPRPASPLTRLNQLLGVVVLGLLVWRLLARWL